MSGWMFLSGSAPGDNPVQAVIDGKAQFGVGSSSLLLARNAGASGCFGGHVSAFFANIDYFSADAIARDSRPA